MILKKRDIIIFRWMTLLICTLIITSCFTVSQNQNAEVYTNDLLSQKKSVNLEFVQESMTWNGTITLFTQDESKHTKAEIISVLREFGIDISDKPQDLRLKVRLRIKETSCETLFIKSNCFFMLFVGPVSFYLIPTSLGLEHEVTIKMQESGKEALEIKNSVVTKTYAHVILIPLLPLELWRLINAEFRLNLYRGMLSKALKEYLVSVARN